MANVFRRFRAHLPEQYRVPDASRSSHGHWAPRGAFTRRHRLLLDADPFEHPPRSATALWPPRFPRVRCFLLLIRPERSPFFSTSPLTLSAQFFVQESSGQHIRRPNTHLGAFKSYCNMPFCMRLSDRMLVLSITASRCGRWRGPPRVSADRVDRGGSLS
ncbi:hypothetical protein OH76DRAFT_1405336 [Lentinus brumalis]|uniref:Uncharacterized protein n=1 Tax=Lentinus brumalis TaxID=2498619 RepID=A0A371D6G6_9APHY|nr:hypothetical protein OH76DRAFT_1405336 [Polyporus brumalis]